MLEKKNQKSIFFLRQNYFFERRNDGMTELVLLKVLKKLYKIIELKLF
jgi:hypothetical protein